MTKAKKTPEQKLGIMIQAGTGKPHAACVAEARVILKSLSKNGRDGRTECGDRLQGWVCSLPPGPHPNWNHLNQDDGHWWTQSRAFPYSNAVELEKTGE